MRRIALAALLAGAAIGTIAGLSSAAKPSPGSWSGKHTHFTVNAAMTRITDWTSKCTGYPLPLKMKVAIVPSAAAAGPSVRSFDLKAEVRERFLVHAQEVDDGVGPLA